MSTFLLKIIALVLMLLDHIYQFLGFTGLIPLFFTWLGRISAPIFFFTLAEGMAHTHDRAKYLLRLYGCSVAMGIGNLIVSALLPGSPIGSVTNNIFATLFLGGAVIFCMEEMAKDRQKGQAVWLLFIGIELGAFFISDGLTRGGYSGLAGLLQLLIPTPFTVEGGVWFVMLGPLFYYFRYSKPRMALMYLAFSLVLGGGASVSWLMAGMSVWDAFFGTAYQWMMVFSLPFLWLYNGQKGKYSMKYLFYLFYPLHTWALYAISAWIG